MNDDARLLDLLIKYEDAKAHGRLLTVEELCMDCPELLDAVHKRLAALERINYRLADLDLTPNTSSVSTNEDPCPHSPDVVESLTLSGRYEDIRFFAAGGMGEVWKAREVYLNRLVVIKVLKNEHLNNAEAARRFLREAEVTSRLDHPGIAPVHAVGRLPDGRPCYVMRFIEGRSLQDAIVRFHGREIIVDSSDADRQVDAPRRSGPVSFASLAFRELLGHFVTVCEIVAFAHSRGIVHRDLKPANIMLGSFGETLVIDWGLARLLPGDLDEAENLVQDRCPLTRTTVGAVVGTPAFMSPEQAEGRTRAVGPLSDVFSLGATLYVLLTCRLPFRQSHIEDLLARIRRGDFPPPRATGQVPVPAALQAICVKAMAHDPQQRYASALELARDLKRWLADEPVSAYQDSVVDRARRFARHHRNATVATALGLALTVLAILTGLTAVQQRQRVATEALQAELRAKAEEAAARAGEARARLHALDVLRAMTDDLIINYRSRGPGNTHLDKEYYQEVLKHFERFADITEEDSASRLIRAEGLGRVAFLCYRLGQMQEARAACEQSLAVFDALLEDPIARKAEFRKQVASTYNLLATVLKELGEPGAAEIVFNKAKSLLGQLHAEFPNRPDIRADLAGCCNNLGNLLADTDRMPQAQLCYQEALILYQQLSAEYPENEQYVYESAIGWNNLGILRHNLSQLKEARSAFQESLAIFQRLAAAYPNHPKYRRDLAMCYNNLANVLIESGLLPDADLALAEAVANYKQLAAEFPTRQEFRQGLAMSYSNRGALLQLLRRPQEAQSHLHHALLIYRQLVSENPNLPTIRSELANTLNNLAVLSNDEQAFQAALEYLSEAEPHHQAALKANPANPEFRQCYRNALWALVKAHAGLLQRGEALAVAEKLRDLAWNPSENAYDAAVALARCIPVVEKLDSLSVEERRAAATWYGDRAMIMLRSAIEKGFQSAATLKADVSLAPLRLREDFQALLAELEKGGYIGSSGR